MDTNGCVHRTLIHDLPEQRRPASHSLGNVPVLADTETARVLRNAMAGMVGAAARSLARPPLADDMLS
ncbi:hypothetical protein GCM10010394_22280 [Streptomyces crystallinus]|uniref:Uncharacterized protein n=1 Tax=Streptomyces crystallinus TaxID=68191 RepID=A0ABN1FK94_9ACTN